MSRIVKFAGLLVVAIIGALVLRALYITASRPASASSHGMDRIRAAAASEELAPLGGCEVEV